jgi:hypothetical protein
MSKRNNILRTWVVLENDAAILFNLLKPLVNERLKKKGRSPVTQSEVVGAVVAAYCLSHRADLLESLNEADKSTFEKALRRHRVVSGLPRSHHPTATVRPPRLPPIPDGAGNTAAPAATSSATAAQRSAAA